MVINMKIIDISRDLLNCPIYPGDPPPEYEWARKIEKGADCNLSVLTACVHTGTHCDAPLHFLADGAGVESLPPEALIGPCTVLELNPGEITGEYVNRHFPIGGCERLLLKSGGKAFFMDSAAQETAALPGLCLIGTDALSVGSKGNQVRPHRAFLSKGIVLLEGLELSAVKPGNYFLFAAPVKLGGLEGAPARAFLIEDRIFWMGK